MLRPKCHKGYAPLLCGGRVQIINRTFIEVWYFQKQNNNVRNCSLKVSECCCKFLQKRNQWRKWRVMFKSGIGKEKCMKLGQWVSSEQEEILLYSEIYGVESTAGISNTNSKFNPIVEKCNKNTNMSLWKKKKIFLKKVKTILVIDWMTILNGCLWLIWIL